jgi:hypothetical protein
MSFRIPLSPKSYFTKPKGVSFEIYDAVGSKVAFTPTQMNESTNELSMHNAPKALYFVKVYNDKGEHIHASKIILNY